MSTTKSFNTPAIGQVIISRANFDLRKIQGGPYQFVFHTKKDRDAFQNSITGLNRELFITDGLMMHAIGNTLMLNLPDDLVLWLSCNASVRNFLTDKAQETRLPELKLLFSWSERKFFPLP